MGVRKPGRPRRRQPKPGERVSLGLRVTPEMKRQLDRAAERSGRSQSQEAELRLEQSFRDQGSMINAMELTYGGTASFILRLLGPMMREVGQHAGFAATFTLEGAQNWRANPYAYDQVVRSINALLEKLRPNGEIQLPRIAHLRGGPPELDFQTIYQNLGEQFALGYLNSNEQHIPDELLAKIQSRLGGDS